MLVYHCAERGCALAEEDLKKKKCPTCNHPLNVVAEEVDGPKSETPPPAPPPAP